MGNLKGMTLNQVRIIELEGQLSSQSQLILELTAKLSFLEEKNSMLKKELSLYRNRKNSSNSSIPSSQDPFRIKRTESLLQSAGRNRHTDQKYKKCLGGTGYYFYFDGN